MARYLVSLDTDHIKGYLYAGNRLRLVRSASWLLDECNRKETVTLAEDLGAEKVFAGGGSAMFLTHSEVDAKRLITNVKSCYRERTGAASVSGAYLAVENDRDLSTKFGQLAGLLAVKLREEKNAPKLSVSVGSPFFMLCQDQPMMSAAGRRKNIVTSL